MRPILTEKNLPIFLYLAQEDLAKELAKKSLIYLEKDLFAQIEENEKILKESEKTLNLLKKNYVWLNEAATNIKEPKIGPKSKAQIAIIKLIEDSKYIIEEYQADLKQSFEENKNFNDDVQVLYSRTSEILDSSVDEDVMRTRIISSLDVPSLTLETMLKIHKKIESTRALISENLIENKTYIKKFYSKALPTIHKLNSKRSEIKF